MWGLDNKEGWALKNWCFQTVVLKKTLESPLDSKDIKLVNLKGNQPWITIGRADDIAEAPILWPSDVNNKLIWKHLNAGKDWRQKEKRPTEIEMDMNLSKLKEIVRDRMWRAAIHGITKSQIQLGDWTTTTKFLEKWRSPLYFFICRKLLGCSENNDIY